MQIPLSLGRLQICCEEILPLLMIGERDWRKVFMETRHEKMLLIMGNYERHEVTKEQGSPFQKVEMQKTSCNIMFFLYNSSNFL